MPTVATSPVVAVAPSLPTPVLDFLSLVATGAAAETTEEAAETTAVAVAAVAVAAAVLATAAVMIVVPVRASVGAADLMAAAEEEVQTSNDRTALVEVERAEAGEGIMVG